MRVTFSDTHFLECMIQFELSLARALVKAGIAPPSAVTAIQQNSNPSLFNIEQIAAQARLAGNVAIPFVKSLTVLAEKTDREGAKFVHWGATSQDVLDTALVLQLREALAQFDSALGKLADALARLAELHKATTLAGRTWLQQGPPVTFGLKAAGWLSAVERDRARLHATAKHVQVLQFGGAVGTLAALGPRGHDVAVTLAEELKLELPDIPWHTNRDTIVEVATNLGLLTGTLGKIARDVSLLMQTEVGEALEPAEAGRGGSSAMPHKRNPVGSAVVLAASLRVPGLVSTMLTAMVQEHERGLGGWQAEWETLPEICQLSAGALAHTVSIVTGLEIDKHQMEKNLQATHGLIFAEAVAVVLGKKLGRSAAHELVEAACLRATKNSQHLREVLLVDPEVSKHLSPSEIDQLFRPENYLGSAERFIQQVLSRRNKKG
jgi:3-carboxy-cis,cis-muconate cycloisomerase